MGLFDKLFGKKEPESGVEKQSREPVSNQKNNLEYSKAHLLFLAKFLHPRLKNDVISPGWAKVLNEPSEKAIETFLKEDLLRNGAIQEKIELKFKVIDLKSLLKERNLPINGKKSQLIERLIQNDKEKMESLVSDVEIIICSEKGKLIAEEYLEKEKENKLAIEQKVRSLIQEGNFIDAVKAVSSFEAEQVFPRGFCVDWRNYNPKDGEYILNLIYSKTPKILDSYTREQIDILRPLAAMMYLWGTNESDKGIPSNFFPPNRFDTKTAANLILKHALFLSSIEEFKKSGIENVEIIGTSDSCEECKKNDRKIFKIDAVPELPCCNCSHKLGCRCTVAPVVLHDYDVSYMRKV